MSDERHHIGNENDTQILTSIDYEQNGTSVEALSARVHVIVFHLFPKTPRLMVYFTDYDTTVNTKGAPLVPISELYHCPRQKSCCLLDLALQCTTHAPHFSFHM